jgi:chorismate synthase
MSRHSLAPSEVPDSGRTPALADIEIRNLTSADDFGQCVALQRVTWGAGYGDVVPASLLQVTRKVGGIVLGAFADNVLVGFAYGLTGVQRGRLVHWSHMLAVRSEYRDRGIGVALKRAQREQLQALGVEEIQWTFDPLVARNAHLNLGRLGVHVLEYVCDLYGNTGSALHSFGTDRMVVGWTVTPSPARHVTPHPPEPGVAAFPFTPDHHPPEVPSSIPSAPAVLVPVPADIEALASSDPEAAMQWRRATRAAFTTLLARGFTVSRLEREPRPHYILLAPRDQGS